MTTRSEVDRSTSTLSFVREIQATREAVYDAWLAPEQVTRWWDPTGTPLARCTIDARVGGAFEFVNADNAHGPPFAGTYTTLDRPGHLAFLAMGAAGDVWIEADGAGSRMTVTIRCTSAEHLEMFLRVGVEAGTAQTLDNLVAHLST